MNWGTKIAILYSSFVVLILVMVWMSARQKIDLVAEDYYEQEIKFQSIINKVENSGRLIEQPSWISEHDSLKIYFPSVFKDIVVNYHICLFRPSDSGLDKEFTGNRLGNFLVIPLKTVKKGSYELQLNWNADGVEYYNKGTISIHS